jgi:putative flippase GtrA
MNSMAQLRQTLRKYSQPIIYLTVGVMAVVVDVSLFILLHTLLHVPVELALPLGCSGGLLTSFLLNKFWVFGHKASGHSTTKQAVMYGTLVVINLLFQYVFIQFFALYGVQESLSKTLATGITACWNYVLYQTIIFK